MKFVIEVPLPPGVEPTEQQLEFMRVNIEVEAAETVMGVLLHENLINHHEALKLTATFRIEND